ncbi:prephenate dehydrogenase/arogenate dehydrogenase family protein [Halorussus caseinilyticus]|uniref:Prephenate dehydrogenase/arogenate dehydrogenase family protein n=1 Tax=Halorussus caseinilyticus TaxID=3034025 RepID=A0ABD5WJI5_9EURY|nr:prephenate dehydrogenase/arogenate dehydrogenase family protein [Halorussus sp. DT72]
MKLLVVGSGEMGRWFGEVVATELGDADVAFADADPEVAESVAEAVGERWVSLSTDEQFDAVCVAVPIAAADEVIERHAGKTERALLDVTGQMAGPVDAMAAVAPDRERVSLHPLFAAANAPGNVAVVTDESGPVTDRVLDALGSAGNRLVETTPAEHDEAMETVQAASHAAVLAFAHAAEDVPEGLTTPVFEDLSAVAEQVTGNSPEVYAEIQATFDGAERVADAAARLADAEADEFERLYRDASARDRDGTDEGKER